MRAPQTSTIDSTATRRPLADLPRTLGRLALGAGLLIAGTGHLTSQRQEFQAQVPQWVPLDPDLVVVASGVVELGLGATLVLAPHLVRPWAGWAAAVFFVAIFPGNIAQYLNGTDGFGLDTDAKRLVRLFFQPLLVVWALWSTGAWRSWRTRRTADALRREDCRPGRHPQDTQL